MGVINVDEKLVTLRDLERPYTRSLMVDAMMVPTLWPFSTRKHPT
jgi:hypothetical protein